MKKKEFETLYTRNSNGSINEWSIQAIGEGPLKGEVIVSEGLLSGVKTLTSRKSLGKNIGKMNETSAYEQSCKDAESRWNFKKKKGYKSLKDLSINPAIQDFPLGTQRWECFEGTMEFILEQALPKNRTDANNLSKPMLALPIFDSKTGECRAKFPMIGQPKLNGFRMMCRWEKVMEGEGMFKQEVEKPVFRSRDGIRFDTLEHIEKDLSKDLFLNSDTLEYDIALDGELYHHGWLLQRINSAVNKKNSDTKDLVFCIFDIGIENVSQENRFIRLNSSVQYSKDGGYCDNIGIVSKRLVHSIGEAESITNEWIKEGYEGGIFRDPKAFYQFGKRNKSMLKLKRFMDDEFEITDVIGGDNSPDLGVFVCKTKTGKEFKCTPQGSHNVKREYLTNKANYIGKMLTVRFYEYTKDGLPFHTSGITIREFK